MFNLKIHYFDWAMFNSYVSLPEGNASICFHVGLSLCPKTGEYTNLIQLRATI